MKETPKQYNEQKQHCLKRLLESINSLNSEEAALMEQEVYNIIHSNNLPKYGNKHPIAWLWAILLYKKEEVEKDEALTLNAEG